MSVVGQRSITTTLKNAIKNRQLAHAYLFCGPRGVGKTTCARIFAKTINCKNITDDFEACNQCESCVSFNESRSYNIHELDAASNNSVEDIRNLIDQVRIPPQIGKYSIYIIDEVHMLSSAAFNAFLKTLEEPPSHAIFVLATTEKHKILPTILSRCQIFDFNRIRVEDIVEHLDYVAKSENIEADIDGLNVIAQKADGAMRDALSFFDQIVSFSGQKFSYKEVIENLNVLDYDYYFKLIDAFIENDYSKALLIFNDILNNGFDGHHFITGLSSHLRDLLVCKDAETVELLEVGANIRERYKEQAQKCSIEFLFNALNISNACDLSYKTSKNQRLHVELALVQMSKITEEKKNDQLSETKKKEPEKKKNKAAEEQNEEKTEPKPHTFSIKKALNGDIIQKNGNQNADNQDAQKEAVVTQFSKEQLEKAWKDFADNLGNPRMRTTLTCRVPLLQDNFVIEFELPSSIAEESFTKEVRDDLIVFLRKELKNDKVDVKTKLSKKTVTRKPYTQKDKYKYLLGKNPKLAKLQQDFNLDFS